MEESLHHFLVHSHRRAEHPRAHVWNPSQFQQPLHGSIFAVRPMQDREYNVEARYGAGSRLVAVAPREAALAAWNQRDLRRVVGDDKCCGARSRAVTGIADAPATILRDADQRSLITVGVQGSKDVGGRGSGDFMFSRASTEQQPDRDLATLSSHHSTLRYWPS